MGKSFFLPALLLVVISFVAPEDEKKPIYHECKPFPRSFFDSVPFLLDFARSIAWFFGNLFNAVCFVLNTVVITVCEIISNIFSCLRYAIKLVEYLGCGVRAILQLNYNFVSSVFDWLTKTARFITDSVRSFAEGITSGLVSVFQGILSLIRGIINCIPTGFYRASQSAGAAKNATGLLLYQSFLGWKYVLKTPASALSTIASSIRAVLECLLVSIWNTGLLLVELLCSIVSSSFLGIEFLGKTIHTCANSAWHQMVNFSNWFLDCVQALISLMGRICLEVFHAFVWVMDLTFGNIIRGLYFMCTTICWLVYTSLNEILGCSLDRLKNLQNLITATAYYLPGGRWTLLGFALVTCFIFYSWTVLRVNVFTVAFGLLESSLQGVLAFTATCQISSISRFMPTSSRHEKPCNMSADERDLIEQLERERDKNLCVVCQIEEKNIVVMPCRHMCMCKSCCTQLFQMQRYHRKTCPLCRHAITSTLEIYS